MISHRLLKRQVKKILGPDAVLRPEMEALLAAVNATYEQHDADRKLLQRSMDLSSVEFMELNEQLAEEVRTHKIVLDHLKASIQALGLGALQGDLPDEDVTSLSSILEEQINLRNQAEQRLRESEEGLRSIVESVEEYAIYTLDLGGRITRWNSAATRIYGYARDDVQGRHAEFLLTPHDQAAGRFNELLQEAATYGRAEIQEWRVRKDGSVFWADVTLTALHDVDESANGFVQITRDATARKQAQESLQQAKEDAEAASRAKSDFLANMSHEIRTPMNAVIGMTSLLLDTDLSPEQEEFVQIIRTGGETLLSVINDILDFSKIEAGMLELEAQPFDVQACIEDTLDLFMLRAKRQGIDLAYYADAQAPEWVVGDITRVRQVLVNLVSNAVKFTKEGGVTISVSSEQASGEGVLLHFAIKDTGIGIAKDRMKRLFKSFSQVDSSTTRKYGGTGLGLAISKRLTELMGGRIWVESELGVGTTFHFTVRVEAHTTVEVPASNIGLQKRRVLIVDEHAILRDALCKQVTQWGMEVQAFERSADALRMLVQPNGSPFDVAIFGGQMAQMNGLMLAVSVHTIAAYATLPVVLLGAATDWQQQTYLAATNVTAYVQKPVRQRQLHQALVRALSGSTPAGAVTPRRTNHIDHALAEALPLRILLAEDNLINQKVALHTLERLGYRADAVANGQEAIYALQQRPYDVVLMDVQMPEMDGIEATRRIRAHFPVDRQPRIVAMTANVMQQDRQVCFKAGMDDFISKPVHISVLVEALRRAGTSAH